MSRHIVSDTGPLITLEKLRDPYGFIQKLYEKVLIPTAVRDELYANQFGSWQAYCRHYKAEDLIEVVEVPQAAAFPRAEILGNGESEAIQLALERGLPLLIEEEAGRKVALELGLSISGIAGQVLKAFRAGLLSPDQAERKLRELFDAGRINRRIYSGLLEAVRSGEK